MKPSPCPFSKPDDGIHVNQQIEVTGDTSMGGEFARCMECGAQGPIALYKDYPDNAGERALELWNDRPYAEVPVTIL